MGGKESRSQREKGGIETSEAHSAGERDPKDSRTSHK